MLDLFANAVGILYAPSALFAIALGFELMLLVHFSLVLSRLAAQSKVLASGWGCSNARSMSCACTAP